MKTKNKRIVKLYILTDLKKSEEKSNLHITYPPVCIISSFLMGAIKSITINTVILYYGE